MKKNKDLIRKIVQTVFLSVVVISMITDIVFSQETKENDKITFPVTPELFVDGTFERAEGIAFNGIGDLYVTANRSFWRLDIDGNAVKLADLYTNLGVAAIGERDLLVADFGPTNIFQHGPNDDGIVWRITPEGEKTLAATGGMGDPNFIVVREDGSYLISDDGTDEIFIVDIEGNVSLYTNAIKHPNGLVISPDGKNLYVAQLFKSIGPAVFDNRIWMIPLDKNGNPAGEPSVIGTLEKDDAGLDGLAMDILGRLYVTAPLEGQIWRFDPESGERLLIAENMPGIASVAFGRGDFDHNALYGASTRRGGGKIWIVNVGIEGIALNR